MKHQSNGKSRRSVVLNGICYIVLLFFALTLLFVVVTYVRNRENEQAFVNSVVMCLTGLSTTLIGIGTNTMACHTMEREDRLAKGALQSTIQFIGKAQISTIMMNDASKIRDISEHVDIELSLWLLPKETDGNRELPSNMEYTYIVLAFKVLGAPYRSISLEDVCFNESLQGVDNYCVRYAKCELCFPKKRPLACAYHPETQTYTFGIGIAQSKEFVGELIENGLFVIDFILGTESVEGLSAKSKYEANFSSLDNRSEMLSRFNNNEKFTVRYTISSK